MANQLAGFRFEDGRIIATLGSINDALQPDVSCATPEPARLHGGERACDKWQAENGFPHQSKGHRQHISRSIIAAGRGFWDEWLGVILASHPRT